MCYWETEKCGHSRSSLGENPELPCTDHWTVWELPTTASVISFWIFSNGKKITLSITDHILEFLLHLQHTAKYINMNLPITSRSLSKFPWEITLQQQCLECYCLPTCKAAGTVLCDYMPVFTGPWPSQLGIQVNMEKRSRLGSIMLYVIDSNDWHIVYDM